MVVVVGKTTFPLTQIQYATTSACRYCSPETTFFGMSDVWAADTFSLYNAPTCGLETGEYLKTIWALKKVCYALRFNAKLFNSTYSANGI